MFLKTRLKTTGAGKAYTEWEKMGFSKGTLYCMKQNAKSEKPFTLNTHVKERLENWGKVVKMSRRLRKQYPG